MAVFRCLVADGPARHAANVSGNAGLVDARIHDTNTRGADPYARAADIPRRTWLIDTRINDAHSRCSDADARAPHIPCRAGLIDARVHNPSPRSTNPASNPRARRANAYTRINRMGDVRTKQQAKHAALRDQLRMTLHASLHCLRG